MTHPIRPAGRCGDDAGRDAPRELPPIFVPARDEKRLRALLASRRSWLDEDVRALLTRELDRAIICPPGEIAPDVVTMNSRVLLRRHPGEGLECRTLVYDDAATIGPSIWVFTRPGAALLGMRAGSRMPYETAEGELSLLVVEAVTHQPKAHGVQRVTPFRRRPGFVSGAPRPAVADES